MTASGVFLALKHDRNLKDEGGCSRSIPQPWRKLNAGKLSEATGSMSGDAFFIFQDLIR